MDPYLSLVGFKFWNPLPVVRFEIKVLTKSLPLPGGYY